MENNGGRQAKGTLNKFRTTNQLFGKIFQEYCHGSNDTF